MPLKTSFSSPNLRPRRLDNRHTPYKLTRPLPFARGPGARSNPMKAEHRHELKTNDLSKALLTAGDYFREYGGRVALALAIVIMVTILINTRVKRSRENAARLRSELAFVQSKVDQLNFIPTDFTGVPAVSMTEFEEARAILKRVQDDASDDQLIAQALVAEGHLNWALANYPEISPNSPATTRSSYKLDKDRTAYLKDAADLYEQVIARFGDQLLSVVNARFGLAAIAEQNRQWDQARTHYETVLKMPDQAKSFKQLAEARVKRLDEISKPVMIGHVPDKPILPPPPEPDVFELDGTSTTRPGVSATTGPATRPVTSSRPQR
jgi:tetratricopeptide (TPR) repeat protein